MQGFRVLFVVESLLQARSYRVGTEHDDAQRALDVVSQGGDELTFDLLGFLGLLGPLLLFLDLNAKVTVEQ